MYVCNSNAHDGTVRTNTVIDHELMEEVLKASGLPTNKEVVKRGLRLHCVVLVPLNMRLL